jgi:hypothetical protein
MVAFRPVHPSVEEVKFQAIACGLLLLFFCVSCVGSDAKTVCVAKTAITTNKTVAVKVTKYHARIFLLKV